MSLLLDMRRWQSAHGDLKCGRFIELAETWTKLAAETAADQPLLGALSEIDQGEPYEALPRALKLRWGEYS